MNIFKSKKKLIIFITITALACTLIGLSILIFGADPIVYVKAETGYISPSGIAIKGSIAYVSDATSNKIYSVNLEKNKVTDLSYKASQTVNNVYVKDGYLYSLEGGLEGNLVRLNADTLTVDKVVPTGHTPSDMLIHRGKIYVSCRFSNKVYVYNENNMTFEKEIEVSREPVAMTLAKDNIYVACHLNDKPVTGTDVASASVSVISTSSDTLVKNIQLLNGCGLVKDITTSHDENYVYLTNIMARYTYPTTQIDRGWINTNGISIIQTSDNTLVTSVMLDNVEEGAGNPWGITTQGTNLIVTISGTDEVIVVDTVKMHQNIDKVKKNSSDKLVKSMDDIPNYLPFMDNCKTRIHIGSKGLRDVTVYNGKAYICGYFEGDVSVLDINSKSLSVKIPLGSQPQLDDVRKGEILWNDASIGYQKWQSCASCHPDARADGINWDTLGDGLGNIRSTKSLIASYFTPPILISGSGGMAEDGIRGSFGDLVYATLSEEDLKAIDEYVKSLVPISSPYLNRDGTLTESAKRGKEIFDASSCIKCHYGPYFTDMKLHDERGILKNKDDEPLPFDTPTLVEIWRTGPWLYTGTETSMKNALKNHVSLSLSDNDLTDLSNYVLSIGAEGELYRAEQIKITLPDKSSKYNSLIAGSNIYEITVRKQWDTDKRARVIFTLYKPNDSVITTRTYDLEAMEVGELAKISTNISIPSNLDDGAYYTISIIDRDDPSKKIATDFKIVK